MLLVDVLFENVAQHIWVDFVSLPLGRSSRCHWYWSKNSKICSNAASGMKNGWIVSLQSVLVKDAAVEIGHLAQQGGQFSRPVGFWLAESFVEQAQQELAVEALEPGRDRPVLGLSTSGCVGNARRRSGSLASG